MDRFLLLLLLFLGSNSAALALDYPSNLDSIITVYSTNNQLEQAISYLDALLGKAEKEYGNQSDTFAFFLDYKAKVAQKIGRYNEASAVFEEVIAIYEHNHPSNPIKLVPALISLAEIYIELHSPKPAQEMLHRALDITQQTTPSDFKTIATIYNDLSLTHYLSNTYSKGIEYGQKALEIQPKNTEKDIETFIKSHEHISLSYSGLQQYENAIAMQQKALFLQQQHFPFNHTNLASTLHNLAYYYDHIRRNSEALPYYQKAVEIVRKSKGNKHPKTAIYLSNLANCYQHLKQFKKAEPLLLEAMAIFRIILGDEHPNTLVIINNIGALYDKMQDFEQSKIYYKKAIDLAKKVLGKEHPNCISIQGNLAAVLVQQKNYKEALKLYSELANRSAIVSGPSSVPTIMYHNQIAKCYLLLGGDFYDQALNEIERSITLNAIDPIEISSIGNDLEALSARTFKSNIQFVIALEILSKIQEAIYRAGNNRQFLLDSYQTQKAVAYFSQQLQNTVYTRQDKLNTLEYVIQASGRAIALIQHLEAVEVPSVVAEAITFAEYNKSAILSSALQGNQAINFGGIPDSLKQRERALKKEKAAIKKKIIHSTNSNDQDALNTATQALVDVQLEQDKLRQLLKENYPKYNALKNEQKKLTATIVQEELLEPQTALLEYCVYDSAVYVIVITPIMVQLKKLPIQKRVLRTKIQDFRKSLSNYSFIVHSEQEAYILYTQTAFDLYQILIAPIKNYLPNIKQLIIIPDDDLGHIPFETLLSALPNQQPINYKNLDYLLHDYTIRYSYSASILLENKRYNNGQNNGKILGLAASYNPDDPIASHRSPANQKLRQVLEPLPAAAQEIEILQELFPNSDFLVGKEANEAFFKAKAANYSILHLAMHGMVNPHSPLLSCLAFSEDYDTTENNFLEAHEISNLQLYNDLVVLSACKTGYGEFEQGEGIMSLARSFMYAGTPSLVVSLWEVNDLSTAAIMQLFYQNLAAGMTKDEALRQVKLAFIQKVDGDIAHPIFWSPFIVLGDNQPVHLKPTTAPWLWGAVGGGAVLAGLLFLLVRKRIRRKEVV